MGEKYNGTQRKTKYNDFWYDSQLEAQWAVFWNDAAILAIPQPATFKTGKYYQGKEICYTPDFYLPDYDVFCEVKPSDEFINDCEVQRKISAAMDHHITPIGDGLLILGPMSGFRSSNTKKCLLYGEFYRWHSGAIYQSYWNVGKYGNIENGIYFDGPEGEFYSSNYPRFARKASTTLCRSYDDAHASEIVYKSILNAIYAKNNGIFTFEENGESLAKETEVLDDGLPFIDKGNSDWDDGKPW